MNLLKYAALIALATIPLLLTDKRNGQRGSVESDDIFDLELSAD